MILRVAMNISFRLSVLADEALTYRLRLEEIAALVFENQNYQDTHELFDRRVGKGRSRDAR